MSDRAEPREAEELHVHPQPRQYVNVAIILAVLTAVEVAIYYVEGVRSILVPILIFLAILKFVLVALWFMHLRFDSNIFKRLFVTGLVLALLVFTVVLIFFSTHGGPAPGAG